MIYKINIYKRKIYIKPRPKEDIPGGLILILNKPKDKEKEPFMQTDIKAFKKEYDCPELPQGVWIINAFIKNDK
jgi:hypothetical protein